MSVVSCRVVSFWVEFWLWVAVFTSNPEEAVRTSRSPVIRHLFYYSICHRSPVQLAFVTVLGTPRTLNSIPFFTKSGTKGKIFKIPLCHFFGWFFNYSNHRLTFFYHPTGILGNATNFQLAGFKGLPELQVHPPVNSDFVIRGHWAGIHSCHSPIEKDWNSIPNRFRNRLGTFILIYAGIQCYIHSAPVGEGCYPVTRSRTYSKILSLL